MMIDFEDKSNCELKGRVKAVKNLNQKIQNMQKKNLLQKKLIGKQFTLLRNFFKMVLYCVFL